MAGWAWRARPCWAPGIYPSRYSRRRDRPTRSGCMSGLSWATRGLIVFAVTLSGGYAGTLSASEVAPEKLLSSTTQVYYRWDGVTAHRDAYRKSARGQVLAGATGKFIADVYDRLVRVSVRKMFGDQLLVGDEIDGLTSRHADFRQAVKVPQLLAETGVVVGFELRPPAMNLGRLLGVGDTKSDDLFRLDLQLTIIIPNAAGRPEIAGLCKLLDTPEWKRESVNHRGRTAEELRDESIRVAWWAEGKHFVFTFGTVPVRKAIDRVADAGPGVTAHPLYKQLQQKQKFEVVSRAYGDGAALWRMARNHLVAYGAGASVILLEMTGLTGMQAVRLWEGFDGDESRSVTEVDIDGPREGISKLCKPGKFDLKDLPPLPADANRWSAGVFDIRAGYELLLGWFATMDLPGDSKLTKAGFLEKRQEFADRIDGFLGMKVADMLAAVGDLGLTYQAPGDGILNAGQVFIVRLRDEKEFKKQFGLLAQGVEKLLREDVQVKRRTYHGAEAWDFVGKESAFVRPTIAVCDGWLVMGFYPQSVHGFILRSKGKLPAWKPDERTARAMAAIPPDPAAVQYTDPRPTVKLLLGAGQPLAGYLTSEKDVREFFDPALLPNPDEACKPLFPNLVWIHNDGKTMRWETRESLALPFEMIGVDAMIGYGAVLGLPRSRRSAVR